MILYHTSGEALALSPGLWRRALERAREVGWRPASPLPPPVALDGAPSGWDGGYETAAGQQVSRPDAVSLGLALEQSLADRPDPASALHELAAFCKAGGFLVCPSPGITDSLISLAAHLGMGAVAPSLPGQEQNLKSSGKRAGSTAS